MNKITAKAASLPPRKTNSPIRLAESAILILLLAAFGLVLGAGIWLYNNQTVPPAALSRQTAAAIVARGSEVLGLDESAGIWTQRLVSGQASLGDYLLRVFVSPDYLQAQADDRTFLADIWMVLTGSPSSEKDLDGAEAELTASGSRLVYLNSLLEKMGYNGAVSLPPSPTRLRTIVLAELPQPAGSEIIGLMTITTEVRLTGSDARFRLYTDGRLRQSQPVESTDPSLQNQYTIDWDTRRESAGSHELALMVQTSDGRGVWLALDSYVIPEVIALAAGQPLAGQAAAGQNTWYSLPAADSQALLTVVDLDSNLNLQLLDLQGGVLAATTGVAGQVAALRAKTTETETVSETCYVKITTAATDQPAANYKLAPSLAAARSLHDDQRLLCVLALQDDKVLIQDESGTASWQPAADYEIFDATARLSQLTLTLSDGADAAYVQDFDSSSTLYGLVVDGSTSRLNVSALTMEGSAAALTFQRVDESGGTVTIESGGAVPLSLSENHLKLRVTGYDGSSRTYEINILRPPHSAGYDQTLEQFPGSYRSPLWLMHLQHPVWQFTALQTGIDWATFIAAEDQTYYSLVDANYSPAAWVEANSPVYDGAAWKAADIRIIEYFADPRNALDEINIFQFEKMTFDPAIHNRKGIEAVIKDSFMAQGNAAGIDYAALILRAGETANISPYFLAAKIIQEMGWKGESALAYGSLTGYEGFYNFYNIGSTPNPEVENGALINGARYAQYGRDADTMEITAEEAALLIPWNTPERAIVGGAIWIASRYVQIGQDTLYLQKFDLIDDGTLFTHQYAQNIQMAWSEARNTRKAYAGIGILDEAFLFSIPVFINMPEKPQTLP